MATAPSPLRSEIGPLVARLARVWRRALDQSLSACGLTEASAQPLLILARARGRCTRPGVIAQEMGIEGPSLVRLLDVLQEQRLIERSEDHTDRRARLIQLTPLGKTKAAQADRVLHRIRAELLGDVADQDLATTLAVLRRIEQRADRLLNREVAAEDAG